jgi:hypothetical protein
VPDLRTEILSVLPFSMEVEVATAVHDGHNLG